MSKFVGAFTGKAIELPKYINPEEMHNIITRGCKSTNHIKRFRHQESYTPSPSNGTRAKQERSSETPSRLEDYFIRNGEHATNQNLSQKVLHLKQKISSLKDVIKDNETKYKSQLLNLKRENEKLIQNIKLLKKDQFEEKLKVDDYNYKLQTEAQAYKTNFETFIKSISQMLENFKDCPLTIKEQFNKILSQYLPQLSSDIVGFVISEPIQFITTGQFMNTGGFSDSIEPNKVTTREAIVMKKYKPQKHGELELKLGERVIIIKGEDDELWLGKINDKIGLFPSNHVMLD